MGDPNAPLTVRTFDERIEDVGALLQAAQQRLAEARHIRLDERGWQALSALGRVIERDLAALAVEGMVRNGTGG